MDPAPTSGQQQSLPPLVSKPAKTLTEMNIIDIKSLYKKAYNTLEVHTPTNNDCALNLLKIISRTNHLKVQGITEQHIGEFAFTQQIPLVDHVKSYGNPPYNGPLYISIFFARLGQYNNILIKNEFINPTPDQLVNHRNNKLKNFTIHDAASFRLYLNPETINKEKNIFQDMPPHVAAQEFDELMTDVYALRNKTPESIKLLATILYGPIETKKQ
jgi:hypothetical protein